MEKTKIHFWVPYPKRSAPSQRFRVEQYLPYLPLNIFSYTILSFIDSNTWKTYYLEGNNIRKYFGIVVGFLRRIGHLFQSVSADYIFILREASPVGPPIFEWLLAKVFQKKIIYDFDDAIWIPGGEEIGVAKKWLKATWKVKYIIKWSYKVVGGNEFLCNYARQYNSSVILIPTVVDTDKGHYKTRNQYEGDRIVIGWTGSHTTLHNLEEIEQLIPELKKEVDFDFLVISNKPPDWKFDFIFKKWEVETELDDLLKMHVGVMPLKKGPWFEGKCGFKLIQYLACGIPAIASPVGVNPQIVRHEKDGFLAANKEEWIGYLKILINDADLRNNMGKNGRNHIVDEYSFKRHLPAFLNLFSKSKPQ